MLVGFHYARFEDLAGLWNRCLPEAYRVSAELLKAHTVDCPLFDWGASVIEVDDDAHPLSYVAVKRSAASLYSGPDPDRSHLTAIVCADPKEALEMLAYVKANLRDRGVYELTFGQDYLHFFPGCPADLSGIRDLLTIEGFEPGGECHDLSQDLADHKPLKSAAETIARDRLEVGFLKEGDCSELSRFMGAEFPGRWDYDVMAKTRAEGMQAVAGLWSHGSLAGFCLTQDSSHKDYIGGAVFHGGLGEHWCSIGPIGVAKSIRGKGLGDALLDGTLELLRSGGKRQCVVDWTGLKNWYEKHGFKVSRTYRPFTLKLEDAV